MEMDLHPVEQLAELMVEGVLVPLNSDLARPGRSSLIPVSNHPFFHLAAEAALELAEVRLDVLVELELLVVLEPVEGFLNELLLEGEAAGFHYVSPLADGEALTDEGGQVPFLLCPFAKPPRPAGRLLKALEYDEISTEERV